MTFIVRASSHGRVPTHRPLPPISSPATSWSEPDRSFSLQANESHRVVVARTGSLVAVGQLRIDESSLDGPSRVPETQPGIPREDGSPLGHLLSAYATEGLSVFKRVVGQFGIVIWNRATRELIAVRDPLGLTPLFYSHDRHNSAVSNSLESLHEGRGYDESFIAGFLVDGSCANRTIWSGVLPVPAGCLVTWEDGQTRSEQYWSPDGLTPIERITLEEAADTFRRLVRCSVARAIDADCRTWAQLSGGLDSSTVVAIAAGLAETGDTKSALQGTVTFTDSLGNGDESAFVDLLLERYPLRNERIADEWPWRDGGVPPPRTDQPARHYPFFARDARLTAIIKDAGGTSLLSGVGPDHYLPITAAQVVDLVKARKWAQASDQLCQWTLLTRGSLWRTFPRHVLLPLLPPVARMAWERRCVAVPDWLTISFRRRVDVGGRLASRQVSSGRAGYSYRATVARSVARLAGWVPAWFHLPGVEVRHPYLDRNLVEFCLRLPYYLRTDMRMSKPVLRAALRECLPERVRLRSTKGTVEPRICWALGRERATLDQLLTSPILADIGCVDPVRAREALASSIATSSLSPCLYEALSLETWLSVQSGRCDIGNTKMDSRKGVL